MGQTEKRFGLKNWVNYLQDKPLPVLIRTVQRLKQLFEDPNLSLNRLVPVIEKDPVFTFHLIRLANELNRNEETETNSVELAVSMLGLDRIVKLSSEVPVIKLNHSSVAHKQYFHALDNGYHAAFQAQDLCQQIGYSRSHDIHIAAMFYSIGYWALWRYAPYEMSAIKIQIHEERKDAVLAETDILGCTIQQISQALVSQWKLSSLAVDALNHSSPADADTLQRLHMFTNGSHKLSEKEVKTLKQLRNSNFYPVKLANWLALTVAYGWEKPNAQSLLELISDFIKSQLGTTASLLHQNCVQASREYHLEGIMPPAAMLLLLPSDQVLSYRMDGKKPQPAKQRLKTPSPSTEANADKPPTPISQSVTPVKSDEEAIAEDISYKSQKQFKKFSTKLLSTSDQYNNDREIYTDLLHGLKAGLGVERIALLKITDDGLLSPMLQVGFAENDPMRRFSLDMEIPSLFKRISHKSSTIQLNQHTHHDLWPELPERFKAWCNQQSFLLASIVVDGNVVAFAYADLGADAPAIHSFYFNSFKYLCGASNRCLDTRKLALQN